MSNYAKISGENFDDIAYLCEANLFQLEPATTHYENAWMKLNSLSDKIFPAISSTKTALDRQKIWLDKFTYEITRGSHQFNERTSIWASTHAGLVILDTGNAYQSIQIVQEDTRTDMVPVSKYDLLIIPNQVTRRWPIVNKHMTILFFEITA